MTLDRIRRWAGMLAATVALAGCGAGNLNAPPPDIGDMALGYTIVVGKNAQKVGPSRTAEPEELEAAVKQAVEARIGRQNGEKLYHLGIGVDAYALAVPGIPVVLNPKSVLVVSVTLWDDTAQMKVNAEPEQLTVFESLSPETVVSSGLTQSREQQLANLSVSAAGAIERWLVKNKDWFTPEAVAGRALRAETLAATGDSEGAAGVLEEGVEAPNSPVDTLLVPGLPLGTAPTDETPVN